MLTTEDIKQIFFYCDNKDPNGYYANDVDILEFGRKIEQVVRAKQTPMTEDQVLDFMMNTNLGENGDAILDRVKALVRSVEEFHGIKKAP